MLEKEVITGEIATDREFCKIDLHGEEVEVLREKIAKQNYQLPFLIHPFFKLNLNSPELYKLLSNDSSFPSTLKNFRILFGDNYIYHSSYSRDITKYFLKLTRFIRNNSLGVIAIGEEDRNANHTLNIIRKQGYKGTILYYKTEPESPTPRSGYPFDYYHLAHALHTIQAKTLIVGGRFGERHETGIEIDNQNLKSKGIYTYHVDNKKLPFHTFYKNEIGGINCVSGFLNSVKINANQYAVDNNLLSTCPEVLTVSPLVS